MFVEFIGEYASSYPLWILISIIFEKYNFLDLKKFK